MPGIRDFFKKLSDTQWDVVVQVMNDLQDSTSFDRIESLRQFLQTLNREIDQINRKRDALGQKVKNIEALLPVVEAATRSDASLEVELLRAVLMHWRAALKIETEELRPTAKLEKKYDTERKRELLAQLQGLAAQLGREMESVQKERLQPGCSPGSSDQKVSK